MKLNAMNELEREMILAERAEVRDAARERQRAENGLKQQQEQQQRAAEKVLLCLNLNSKACGLLLRFAGRPDLLAGRCSALPPCRDHTHV